MVQGTLLNDRITAKKKHISLENELTKMR
eukprot:SAG11_NODE_42544_length_178_cov_115.569620_1_plen_28_part_10